MALKKSCNTGEIGECAFLLEAVRRGFLVSQPFGHAQKYDFIVDTGNKLLKVQVKAARWSSNGSYHTLQFNLNTRGNKLDSVTSKFHVLVGYDIDNKDFYMILSKNITGCTFSFSNKTKTYSKHKNNWSAFYTVDK